MRCCAVSISSIAEAMANRSSPALQLHSMSTIAAAAPNLRVSLILGGPDFMKRELGR